MKRNSLAAVFLVGALGAVSASAADLSADFSAVGTQSSSNVWTYGYSSSAGAGYAMTLFDTSNGAGWSMSNYNMLGTPAVWKNTGTGDAYGAAPGQVVLHPGPLSFGDVTIVRFTAGAAGTYAVAGQFFAGDSGDMSAAVVLNGDALHPLQSYGSTNNSPSLASFQQYLGAGQTLDFVVGNNGSFYSGNTPIAVTINAVPEPESYAMLFAGLGLLGFLARRKQAA